MEVIGLLNTARAKWKRVNKVIRAKSAATVSMLVVNRC